jgi:lipopolysaccharide biosynthesis glycosyltransferase
MFHLLRLGYMQKQRFFLILILLVITWVITLQYLKPIKHKEKGIPLNGRFAYAFYATSINYYCSAIVNTRRLLDLKVHGDIIILYKKDAQIPQDKLDHFLNMAPGRTKLVPVDLWVTSKANQYYRNVFMKFSIFSLVEYDRIIYLDSDSLYLQNLDHLFLLPNATVAAPRMYWGKQPFMTSALMIIQPNLNTFELLKQESIKNAEKNTYDMDLLNHLFIDSAILLPGQLLCLNSHWETKDTAAFGNITLNELKAMCGTLHFTALGKPWSYPNNMAQDLRPNADPWLPETYRWWWTLNEKEQCL